MDNNPERKDFLTKSTPENKGDAPDVNKGGSKSFIITMCVLGAILLGACLYGLATDNFKNVMMTVGSIALAILVLLVMITVHELGHYVAGKSLGFGITEFALGFGPAIYRKKRKNGEYFSIRALPIGGFCAFEGEDEESESATAFNSRKPWQRIIVLVAGATMNFVTAILLIVLLFGIYGQSMLSSFEIKPSIEYSQSLENGDVLIKLNGKGIYLQTDLSSALKGKKQGDVVVAEVFRNGKIEKVNVTLRYDAVYKNSADFSGISRALGVAQLTYVQEVAEGSPFKAGDALFREATSQYDVYEKDEAGNIKYDEGGSAILNQKYLEENRIYGEEELYSYLASDTDGEISMWIFRDDDYFLLSFTVPEGIENQSAETVFEFLGITSVTYQDRWTTSTVKLGFFETIAGTFVYAFRIAGSIFTVLGELLTGALGLNAMGGTVTTVVMTSQAIRFGGLKFLLEIAAFIGVNLAVFNLLPIPALDGARVVFTFIEWIFKKPVNKKVEGIIHMVGLVLLLCFAVLVDVMQLF